MEQEWSTGQSKISCRKVKIHLGPPSQELQLKVQINKDLVSLPTLNNTNNNQGDLDSYWNNIADKRHISNGSFKKCILPRNGRAVIEATPVDSMVLFDLATFADSLGARPKVPKEKEIENFESGCTKIAAKRQFQFESNLYSGFKSPSKIESLKTSGTECDLWCVTTSTAVDASGLKLKRIHKGNHREGNLQEMGDSPFSVSHPVPSNEGLSNVDKKEENVCDTDHTSKAQESALHDDQLNQNGELELEVEVSKSLSITTDETMLSKIPISDFCLDTEKKEKAVVPVEADGERCDNVPSAESREERNHLYHGKSQPLTDENSDEISVPVKKELTMIEEKQEFRDLVFDIKRDVSPNGVEDERIEEGNTKTDGEGELFKKQCVTSANAVLPKSNLKVDDIYGKLNLKGEPLIDAERHFERQVKDEVMDLAAQKRYSQCKSYQGESGLTDAFEGKGFINLNDVKIKSKLEKIDINQMARSHDVLKQVMITTFDQEVPVYEPGSEDGSFSDSAGSSKEVLDIGKEGVSEPSHVPCKSSANEQQNIRASVDSKDDPKKSNGSFLKHDLSHNIEHHTDNGSYSMALLDLSASSIKKGSSNPNKPNSNFSDKGTSDKSEEDEDKIQNPKESSTCVVGIAQVIEKSYDLSDRRKFAQYEDISAPLNLSQPMAFDLSKNSPHHEFKESVDESVTEITEDNDKLSHLPQNKHFNDHSQNLMDKPRMEVDEEQQNAILIPSVSEKDLSTPKILSVHTLAPLTNAKTMERETPSDVKSNTLQLVPRVQSLNETDLNKVRQSVTEVVQRLPPQTLHVLEGEGEQPHTQPSIPGLQVHDTLQTANSKSALNLSENSQVSRREVSFSVDGNASLPVLSESPTPNYKQVEDGDKTNFQEIKKHLLGAKQSSGQDILIPVQNYIASQPSDLEHRVSLPSEPKLRIKSDKQERELSPLNKFHCEMMEHVNHWKAQNEDIEKRVPPKFIKKSILPANEVIPVHPGLSSAPGVQQHQSIPQPKQSTRTTQNAPDSEMLSDAQRVQLENLQAIHKMYFKSMQSDRIPPNPPKLVMNQPPPAVAVPPLVPNLPPRLPATMQIPPHYLPVTPAANMMQNSQMHHRLMPPGTSAVSWVGRTRGVPHSPQSLIHPPNFPQNPSLMRYPALQQTFHTPVHSSLMQPPSSLLMKGKDDPSPDLMAKYPELRLLSPKTREHILLAQASAMKNSTVAPFSPPGRHTSTTVVSLPVEQPVKTLLHQSPPKQIEPVALVKSGKRKEEEFHDSSPLDLSTIAAKRRRLESSEPTTSNNSPLDLSVKREVSSHKAAAEQNFYLTSKAQKPDRQDAPPPLMAVSHEMNVLPGELQHRKEKLLPVSNYLPLASVRTDTSHHDGRPFSHAENHATGGQVIQHSPIPILRKQRSVSYEDSSVREKSQLVVPVTSPAAFSRGQNLNHLTRSSLPHLPLSVATDSKTLLQATHSNYETGSFHQGSDLRTALSIPAGASHLSQGMRPGPQTLSSLSQVMGFSSNRTSSHPPGSRISASQAARALSSQQSYVHRLLHPNQNLPVRVLLENSKTSPETARMPPSFPRALVSPKQMILRHQVPETQASHIEDLTVNTSSHTNMHQSHISPGELAATQAHLSPNSRFSPLAGLSPSQRYQLQYLPQVKSPGTPQHHASDPVQTAMQGQANRHSLYHGRLPPEFTQHRGQLDGRRELLTPPHSVSVAFPGPQPPQPLPLVTSQMHHHMQDIPHEMTDHVLDSFKRKRGRPRGSTNKKRVLPVSEKPQLELKQIPEVTQAEDEVQVHECRFCDYKANSRGDVRQHVKDVHFAKFRKDSKTANSEPNTPNAEPTSQPHFAIQPAVSRECLPHEPSTESQIREEDMCTMKSVGVTEPTRVGDFSAPRQISYVSTEEAQLVLNLQRGTNDGFMVEGHNSPPVQRIQEDERHSVHESNSPLDLREHSSPVSSDSGEESPKPPLKMTIRRISTNNNVEEEKLSYQSSERRPKYSCEVCGASYNYINGLREHESRHRLDHPHECAVCHLKYKTAGMLSRHQAQKGHQI